jgi:hypothetical protein
LWLAIKGKKEWIFIATWVLIIFGIFTLSKTKLYWYITPIYPALSISAGALAAKIFKRHWLIFLVLVIGIIAMLGFRYRLFDTDLNREVKSLAAIAKGHSSAEKGVYLYQISDPGVRFYFGDVFKRIENESEFAKVLFNTKGSLFVMEKDQYNTMLPKMPPLEVLSAGDHFILFSD